MVTVPISERWTVIDYLLSLAARGTQEAGRDG
jgi:hypothetical protein